MHKYSFSATKLPWVNLVDVSEKMITDKLPNGIHLRPKMCYETVSLKALENVGCDIENKE